MDLTLIEPFIDGTITVLETMAFTKAEAGKPYKKKGQEAKGDISGVIGLTGQFNATISVSFSEKSILRIVSNMLGEKMQEINDDIKDAVGELTNMIAGQARKGLAALGKQLQAAIPSVVTGKNHTIEHISDSTAVAIPFHTDGGKFTVEVCFDG
jgi:chemotaxis protein CheX